MSYTGRISSFVNDDRLPNLTIDPFTFKGTPPWMILQVKVCQDNVLLNMKATPLELTQTAFLVHASSHGNTIPVYTDGYKTDNGVRDVTLFPKDRITEATTLP